MHGEEGNRRLDKQAWLQGESLEPLVPGGPRVFLGLDELKDHAPSYSKKVLLVEVGVGLDTGRGSLAKRKSCGQGAGQSCAGTVGRRACLEQRQMEEKKQRMSAQHPHFFGFMGKW